MKRKPPEKAPKGNLPAGCQHLDLSNGPGLTCSRYAQLTGIILRHAETRRLRGRLGVLDTLNLLQPTEIVEPKPGHRRCPTCGKEFPIVGPITLRHPQTTCSKDCAYRYRGRTSRPCLMLTPELANGLARLIDGEGCIRVRRNCASIVAEVLFGNTDHDVVDLFWLATGLGSVNKRKPKVKRHATSWHWKIQSQGAHGLLEQLLPYLEVKHRQARLATYVQERRLHAASRHGDRTWQDEAVRLSLALNAKGKKTAVPQTVLGGGLILI